MAGTDSSRDPAAGGPAVILVEPQLGENIGTAARAMMNCGLDDLRLVRPRCRWPHSKAARAATGAAATVEKAKVFPTIEEAIADLNHVFATCPRRRDMVKPVIDHRAAAADLRAMVAAGERPGILFGPERTGLENDDVGVADALLTVPLNPDFTSLNLAQAVLVAAYEWRMAGDATPGRVLALGRAETANRQEVLDFFARLEAELDECGFLRNKEMRPTMVRNIRNIFHRAGLMAHEVRTLQGIVTGLTQRPHAERARSARSAKPAGKPARPRRGRGE